MNFFRPLAGAVLLIAVTTAAYLPALQGGFIWDDDAHLTKPQLRSLDGLPRIWFDPGATQQYYPLLHSAFWVEYQLWGEHTLGYHLVNLALHTAAALLVYVILRKLQVPGPWLAAAIFALHPVHVESVAWISEQKNTLSAVFYLGSMLVYLHFDQTRKTSLYAAASGLFVLGLLSKTVTATLPAALLLIFWWRRGTLSWRRDVRPLIGWFMLGAIAGLFTAWVERKLIGAEGAAFELTLLQRGLLAGRVIWLYLGKLIWPSDLIFIYPRWEIDPSVWWQWLFTAAAVAVLVLLWATGRRWRAPLAGWLFFVGTLFPVLGFFNVFPFVFSFVADHFQYLASLGIIVLAASGIALGLARLPPSAQWIRVAVCAVLLGILGTLTWQQSRMYDDIFALYQTTIDRNPRCWMAHYNLGNELLKVDKKQEAIQHFQQAIVANPDFAAAYDNLGLVLAETGRLEEGKRAIARALELDPESAKAHYNLGLVYARAGQLREAIGRFEQAIGLDGEYADAYTNLGTALCQSGRVAEGIEKLEHALTLKSDDAVTHKNLGTALASLGRSDEAIGHYETAVRLKPNDVVACASLADAYAAVGQGAKAVSTGQRALELARARGDTSLAARLEARLREYQSVGDGPKSASPPPDPSP